MTQGQQKDKDVLGLLTNFFRDVAEGSDGEEVHSLAVCELLVVESVCVQDTEKSLLSELVFVHEERVGREGPRQVHTDDAVVGHVCFSRLFHHCLFRTQTKEQ